MDLQSLSMDDLRIMVSALSNFVSNACSQKNYEKSLAVLELVQEQVKIKNAETKKALDEWNAYRESKSSQNGK